MVETSVTQLPHEDDGVVKTFIDRYTTMIVRDQALLEEVPAPHFAHH